MVKFCLKKGGFGGKGQSYHIVNKVYYRSIIMEAWLGGGRTTTKPRPGTTAVAVENGRG